jgi:hypothetical protein
MNETEPSPETTATGSDASEAAPKKQLCTYTHYSTGKLVGVAYIDIKELLVRANGWLVISNDAPLFIKARIAAQNPQQTNQNIVGCHAA